MAKQKMTPNTIPNDFTLSLVLVDGLPVLFFSISFALAANMVQQPLFLIGTILIIFAGVCKVLWKLIVVLKKRNIWFLFVQMRISMPVGFGLILLSLLFFTDPLLLKNIWRSCLETKAVVFFAVGLMGMMAMGVFAKVLDGRKAKNNWVEQITNTIAQLCVLIGMLLLRGQ